MRSFPFAVRLAFAISLVPVAFGQQPPTASPSAKAPAGSTQEKYAETDARRQRLVAQAKQTFAEETARQQAGDCANAQTTVDFDTCFGKAAGLADQSLKSYEESVRGILGLVYPGPSGESSQVLTPAQAVAEFDRLEKLWQDYLDTASTAAFHQMDGGSGGPSFGLQTRLRLTRNHLKELHNIYGELWL